MVEGLLYDTGNLSFRRENSRLDVLNISVMYRVGITLTSLTLPHFMPVPS